MPVIQDLEADVEFDSPLGEIASKLRTILDELDRLGESLAAIHVNNAIEALDRG